MGDDVLTITLAGPPRGKGRPKFIRATGHAYTPKPTAEYEGLLRHEGALVMDGRAPIEGPLNVTLVAYMPVPESWSKKKRREALANTIHPTGKPDLDNLLKMLDAFNMVVWRDDAQIVSGSFTKRYSDRPRLVVEVRPTPMAYFDHVTGEVRDAALPLLAGAA